MAQSERWLMSLAKEARTAPEFAAFVAFAAPLIVGSPRGDGHPVLILPGLGGGDTSTRPMRWFLDRLGYRTYGWGMGRNTGLSRRGSAQLRDRLDAVADEHGQRVSLVGWSLGGVYANRPRPARVASGARRDHARQSTRWRATNSWERPDDVGVQPVRRDRALAGVDHRDGSAPRERPGARQPSRSRPQPAGPGRRGRPAVPAGGFVAAVRRPTLGPTLDPRPGAVLELRLRNRQRGYGPA